MPRPAFIPNLPQNCGVSGAGGNLTTDALLAVLARSPGATLCSADEDFRRFRDVPLCNPLSKS